MFLRTLASYTSVRLSPRTKEAASQTAVKILALGETARGGARMTKAFLAFCLEQRDAHSREFAFHTLWSIKDAAHDMTRHMRCARRDRRKVLTLLSSRDSPNQVVALRALA